MMASKYSSKEIAELFTTFTAITDISSASYIVSSDLEQGNKLPMLQVKAGDIFVGNTIVDNKAEHYLDIKINNRTVAYLNNKISPIVKAKNDFGDMQDMNRLYLSLAHGKVHFPDKDMYAYLPLLLVEIEDKELMYSTAQKSGEYILNIKFSDKLLVNYDVVRYFFDIKFEENGKEHVEFISTTIEEFIPNSKRGSLKEIMEYIYSFFMKKSKNDNFIFPELNGDDSSVMMFFSTRENYKAKREFNQIAEDKNPLVEQYLHFFNQGKEEGVTLNKAPELTNDIYYGSLTRDYPLGEGQATVMQQNNKNVAIIPVVGGPGTGKSTLILSLIANAVTTRAMSIIFNNKDYNNLTLLTATANKAVENVYKNLKRGFKHGFVFVGGRASNMDASGKEVGEYIELLNGKVFDSAKMQASKNEITTIVATMSKTKKNFDLIQEVKDVLVANNVKDFDGLLKARGLIVVDKEKIEVSRKAYANVSKLLKKLETLVSRSITTEEIFSKEVDILAELELAQDRLNNLSLLERIGSKKSQILKEISFCKVDSTSDLKTLIAVIKDILTLKDDFLGAKEILRKNELITKSAELTEIFKNDEANFAKMLSYKTFGDFFRLEMYNLNYKLYISSLQFLEQRALLEKENVIKALGYLMAADKYNYLMEHYGRSVKNQEEMLRLISLAYPIFTTTLASVTNMFPGINPSKVQAVRTVIADEAGMITCSDLLPALRRSKRAVVIGDPKQLAPIVAIEEVFLEALEDSYEKQFWDSYSPSLISAFHRAAGTFGGSYLETGTGIILDEHRRCAKEIAELFINIADYKGLKICSGKCESEPFKAIKNRLMFFDVSNPDTKSFKKVNKGEISVINKLLKRLSAVGYDLQRDVGIITPYKEQEATLITQFGEMLGHTPNLAKIGTVHKFQGVEFKVVIFSSVCSREQDSLKFINQSPSLINVAVSRAIESFIVVGDYERLTINASKDKNNFIGRMAQYIKANGFFGKMKAEDIKLKTSYSYKNFSGKTVTVDPTKVFNEFEELEGFDYSTLANNDDVANWGIEYYYQA
jgi:superfamily I DNA/RNA helicase